MFQSPRTKKENVPGPRRKRFRLLSFSGRWGRIRYPTPFRPAKGREGHLRVRLAWNLVAAGLVLLLLFYCTFQSSPTGPTTDCPAYQRDDYQHWIDEDGDCQNVRHEILQEQSQIPVTFTNHNNCTVATGEWYDPFTGQVFTLASDVDIDHVVPLAEAHESGAWAWPAEQKREFANFRDDPYHLMPVDDGTNQSKGKRDPSEWLPPDASFHREYARIWAGIKVRWGLTADAAELEVLSQLLKGTGTPLPELEEEARCSE